MKDYSTLSVYNKDYLELYSEKITPLNMHDIMIRQFGIRLQFKQFKLS